MLEACPREQNFSSGEFAITRSKARLEQIMWRKACYLRVVILETCPWATHFKWGRRKVRRRQGVWSHETVMHKTDCCPCHTNSTLVWGAPVHLRPGININTELHKVDLVAAFMTWSYLLHSPIMELWNRKESQVQPPTELKLWVTVLFFAEAEAGRAAVLGASTGIALHVSEGQISALYRVPLLWECEQWIHILRAAELLPGADVNFVLSCC